MERANYGLCIMWRHRPSSQEGVERHDEEKESSDDDENEVDATYESSISYPNFIELKSRRNRIHEPVVDVSSSMFKSHDTVFHVTGKDYCGMVVEVKASPKKLMEKYFPGTLVNRIVQASNQY
eukprot:13079014-Ditylum_brightwellii.AAC.1